MLPSSPWGQRSRGGTVLQAKVRELKFYSVSQVLSSICLQIKQMEKTCKIMFKVMADIQKGNNVLGRVHYQNKHCTNKCLHIDDDK